MYENENSQISFTHSIVLLNQIVLFLIGMYLVPTSLGGEGNISR